MKKSISLLMLALAGFAFTACEDVPEPYTVNTGTSSNTASDVLLSETFASSLGKFQSKSESGDLAWYTDFSSAVITGYQDFDGDGSKENKAGVTYLVSPAIDLTDVEAAYVSLSQAINYQKTTIAEDHKLLISPDYTGDVATATWTELPLSFDGVGGSFTFADQQIQIPEALLGQPVVLALKHTAHDTYSSTWEVKNLKVQKGTAGEGGSTDPTPTEGEGTGTAADPYNVAAAISVCQALAADVNSAEVYIKGVISQIDEVNTQYGNATYYISDDGTTAKQLEVYRGYGLNGNKFTSASDIKVGDSVIIVGKLVNFKGNTLEVTSGSKIYQLNGEGGGDTPQPGDGTAKGSGTLEDPYNAVAANALAESLADNAQSDIVYIQGKVVSIKEQYGAQYGNATFYISEDGTSANQFYVYRALYLGNAKYTSGDLLKEGDDVVICGKVTKYVSSYGTTLETVQNAAYLYSLNSNTGGNTPNPDPNPGEGTGSGTLADPYNAVAASALATALGSGGTSSESYYIKGKVSEIKYTFSAQYGTATFYISDDGTTANQFYVYSTYYLGNKSWVEGNTQIALGDDVIIYGQLANYNGTPETASKKSYIYSLNGVTEGGDNPNPDPNPGTNPTLADFTNGDFETWEGNIPTGWKTTSTAGNATLSQSTDAHGGSYAVCVGGLSSANKRLAYQEMDLEAGTYTCTFWTKAATDKEASLCPGHAVVGSTVVYNYDKGDDGKNRYVNNIGSSWQQVTFSFTLAAKSTVCLIVMNSKTTGTDLLIDDFTITKD